MLAAQVKVIDCSINVRDTINFCANVDKHIMSELKNTYEGKCFKGAFINRVVKVVQRSRCVIVKTNLSAHGVIDVSFLAEVTVVGMWDILVGVSVLRTAGMIVGSYKRPPADPTGRECQMAVTVIPTAGKNLSEVVSTAHTVCVRVCRVEYPAMQPYVTLAAAMLSCDRSAPAWRLRGSLDPTSATSLAPLLASIDTELAARAELVAAEGGRAAVWFFERLLYSYDGGDGDDGTDTVETYEGAPPWEGPHPLRASGGALHNILDVARRAAAGETIPVTGCWCRDLALYRSSPYAAFVAGPELPAGWAAETSGAPVDGAPSLVFGEMLKNMLDFLVAVRQMAELYPVGDETYTPVWHAMRSVQVVE